MPARGTVLLVIAVAGIFALTLVPTDADNDVELVPFAELVEAFIEADLRRVADFVLEAAANIALFVPLGMALRLRGVSLLKTAVGGLVVSGAVEGAQLLVSGRTTSVDDMLLNMLGTILGYLVLARWRARLVASGSE